MRRSLAIAMGTLLLLASCSEPATSRDQEGLGSATTPTSLAPGAGRSTSSTTEPPADDPLVVVDQGAAPSVSSTMVTAAHEIRIEDCATGPSHPFDFTTRPFLAQGCVETPARTFNVGRFYPDGDWVMEDEPIPGVECMAEWLPDSSSGGPCVEEDNVFGFVAGSWSEDGGIRYSMAIVTDETVRVVAATSGGEQIVAIPYERMAFLWWDSGDLINVVAETPAGDVDLLQVGS